MPMIHFHTRCPDVAQRETRFALVSSGLGDLPPDEYAFLERYCDDPKCDCRRVFIEVLAKSRPGATMASINYGWEPKAYYQKLMPYMPEAADEITQASLDPLNAQSEFATGLLELFRTVVADPLYKARLKQHYEQFRRARRQK
jgi:hypothetical protein